jgi:hypothetical protein
MFVAIVHLSCVKLDVIGIGARQKTPDNAPGMTIPRLAPPAGADLAVEQGFFGRHRDRADWFHATLACKSGNLFPRRGLVPLYQSSQEHP